MKKISLNLLASFALVCLAAKGEEIALKGQVSDRDNNWLPEARVALRYGGAETMTDGNGRFELKFKWKMPNHPGPKGELNWLEIDKEGYLGQSIAITNTDWFAEQVAVKLEQVPVAEDLAHFTMRMRTSGSVHGLPRRLKVDAKEPIAVEVLAEGLEQLRRRAEENPYTERVEFYGYAPAGVEKLKAVFLIALHGMGSVDHQVLRDFADREKLALVGVKCHQIQTGSVPVAALDEPLRKMGELLGHGELVDLPVLTFGHSNGTGFATVYAAERPERLIGWVSYHSGYAWQLQLPGVELVPGLVLHGHKDEWFEHGQEEAVRGLRRERNAPVSLLVEGNVGHGPLDTPATWKFVVAFCEAAMRNRLAADGSLRAVEMEKGWLGECYDREKGGQQRLEVVPWGEFTGEKEAANWLIDGEFAKIWQEYAETDPREKR